MVEISWQEEARGLAEYHRQKQEEHGKGKAGERGDDKGWGIRDTAKEQGLSFRHVIECLRLADTLSINAICFDGMSRNDALHKLGLRLEPGINKEIKGWIKGALKFLEPPLNAAKLAKAKELLEKAIGGLSDA